MKLRSMYNYDVNAASDEAGLDCSVEKSLTRQEFREECDINTILRRFGITGQLPENVRMPTYGDFVGVRDFQTAMNAVASARESFDAMPAHVRSRFGNDPGAFVDFCSDVNNLEEARRLGLAVPAEAQATPLAGGVVQRSTASVPDPAPSGTITNT